MTDYDERLFDLRVQVADDGDLMLWQDDSGHEAGEVLIRIHRSALPMIVDYCNGVSYEILQRAIDYERRQFDLLATSVIAHTNPGEPLRVLCELLSSGLPIRASPRHEAPATPAPPTPSNPPNQNDLFGEQTHAD